MLLGERMSGEPFRPGRVQLPRDQAGRALIGDPRTTRTASSRSCTPSSCGPQRGRRSARRKGETSASGRCATGSDGTTSGFLIKDFLPTILDKKTFTRASSPVPSTSSRRYPGSGRRPGAHAPGVFSVAAYRFGHSMIRPQYQLNPDIVRPIFLHKPDDDADLGDFRPIQQLGYRLQYFIQPRLRMRGSGRRPQLSYKIDTSLVHPLGNLPRMQTSARPPTRGAGAGSIGTLPSDGRLPSGWTREVSILVKTAAVRPSTASASGARLMKYCQSIAQLAGMGRNPPRSASSSGLVEERSAHDVRIQLVLRTDSWSARNGTRLPRTPGA